MLFGELIIWNVGFYFFENKFLVRKPVKKKKTQVCYFTVPDDDTTHSKLEVII